MSRRPRRRDGKPGASSTGDRRAPAASRSPGLRLTVLVVVVAIAAAVLLWRRHAATSGTQSAPPAAAAAASPGAARSAQPAVSPQVLLGRWLRPDGGYVLEIRAIRPDDTVDAAYFNPRAINVALAKVSTAGGAVRLFVELRDAGYPGSTYDLVYLTAPERLEGTYYQAAIGQRFEVLFTRMAR